MSRWNRSRCAMGRECAVARRGSPRCPPMRWRTSVVDAGVVRGRRRRSTVLRVHATGGLPTRRQDATRRLSSPRARGGERNGRRAGYGRVRGRGLCSALRCASGQRVRQAKSRAGRARSTKPGAAEHDETSSRTSGTPPEAPGSLESWVTVARMAGGAALQSRMTLAKRRMRTA